MTSSASSSSRAASTDFLPFTTHLYHPSLPAGLPGYILCPYRSVVDKFQLVVLRLRVRVKGSMEEHRLWVRLCSSSSVPHVLDGLQDGWLVAVLLPFCGMLLQEFVYHLFVVAVKLFLYTLSQDPVVWTWSLLGKKWHGEVKSYSRMIYTGSDISCNKSDINISIGKAWATIDSLLIIWIWSLMK